MTETQTPVWQPPEIPSKWDVIPIHNSDRGAFKRCRRYWDWSSPARHNLTVRADINGINVPMWFGTGVHYALQGFYAPTNGGIRRDPVEVFKTWFDIQYRGGVVTVDWLDLVHDLNPKPISPDMAGFLATETKFVDGQVAHEPVTLTWLVRGLEDILPDPDQYEFDELLQLGVNMLTFYKEYAAREDGFEVLVAEHDFSVPVWDYENDCILMAVDAREDSPNYGKRLEVHARGRMDAIWTKPNGKLGILENKTAAQIGEDTFRKLESDEQCTTYLWAAEVEAQYYNLPHAGQPLEEVIFNVLRKAHPKPPTIVRGGLFSVNRAEESTTHDLLMAWIKGNGIDVSTLDEKHQNYITYLQEVGDEQFIIRKNVRRNRHQLQNAGFRLYLEAMDMLSNPRIYPNITNDYLCLNCQFRTPCLAQEDGSDYEQLIRDNYTTTRDR